MMKESDGVNTEYYKEKLELLGCPYIVGIEGEYIKDLLFRPGEARVRVFSWMLSQISPHVDTELNSPVMATGSVKDSKIQRLVKVCSGLGLCGRNDYELIQGNCPLKRQHRFYCRLLDLLQLSHSIPRDGDVTTDQNTLDLCNTTSRQCYTVVEQLVGSCVFKDLFKCDLDMFPGAPILVNNQNRKTQPSLEKLKDRSQKLVAELETLDTKLGSLPGDSNIELEPARLAGYQTTLTNTLTTLSQSIATFEGCYREEFKPWSGRPGVEINDMGLVCKQLDEQLDKVLRFLEDVGRYNESVRYIESSNIDTILAPSLSQSHCYRLAGRVKLLKTDLECSVDLLSI